MIKSKQAIIYHDKCRDGTCGLCVVNEYLKSKGFNNNLIIPGNYKNLENIFSHDLKDHEVTFVDFCLTPEDMEKLSLNAKKIKVLDHHDGIVKSYNKFLTHQEDGFLKGFFLNNVELVLDPHRSGALVAWDYLMKTPAPQFINYISDVDIFTFKLEGSKNFSARMGMEQDNLENYEKLIKMNKEEIKFFINEGEILEKQFEQFCQKNSQKAASAVFKFNGQDFFCDIVVSTNELLNRTCEILYEKSGSFSVAISSMSQKEYKLSFRSKKYEDGSVSIDVQPFAKFFGGDGHHSAAGCYIDKKNFDEYFKFIQPNASLNNKFKI